MNSTRVSRVRLTASATSALPRWLLLAICVIYGLSGLFYRDPWKNEDAAGFGVMWSLATGNGQDWLMPNIVGRPFVQAGPLVFWIGGAFIRVFGQWMGPSDASRLTTALFFFVTCACIWYGAYLLGRRAEVQPFEFVFGGQPSPLDYGRTLADGALLIFLACVGLAQRGHETTPLVGALCFVALTLYGLIRALDRPVQGSLIYGFGIGCLSLAGGPILPLVITLSVLVTARVTRVLPIKPLLTVALPVSLVLGWSWPAMAYLLAVNPTDAVTFIREWARFDRRQYTGPTAHSLGYIARNLPPFAWPVWPLAAWAWKSWGGMRTAPHIALPLAILLPQVLLLLLQPQPGDDSFLLLIPPMAVMATFALPTLKRAAINAIDWFALLAFTLLGGFVWLVWIAKITGYPAQIARNVFRLLPGYRPTFSWTALLCALLVTAAWVLIVVWRTSRVPKAIWRAVVISAAGTTLLWVLMMTLWLPTIDYAKTYREVAQSAALALPRTYTCVQPIRIGDAQLASFAYFGHIRFGNPEDNCDILLRHDPYEYGDPSSMPNYEWRIIWEGRRPADRDERFRMYRLTEAAKATHPPPVPATSRRRKLNVPG
ncbi:ArnT family glycosyltransferase [Ralstonia solanacearum]|uniref:Glycosyltransferase pmt family n=1 Tax=Ralstonia solanacearum (strain Po82) TaxID=1031711 RepID=F6G352_RALS8|nr:glycosyltransferase family 39 protein [Ralstonia solanacearum]AEG69485.1 glycosyltransferase pmt family [Ralstonia solanacearum Po82]AMP70241.1 UDP phosphate-alpha-4-amino-4-deoxy-L-arabinose arabinosyl transferase [Ralstonia solanacearum]AMP75406.1 UDP phosphate-alpha-4-amino-4-deoxy-L-arabinose arabinosyl transferase [Ralstonia solanacearum]AYB60980.1 glycosyltransferase family 39 protein [Ralstonia solanacearum]MBB6587460.1 glycosyltransferase family 39 protein [Ralstonia solanacearum]